MALADGIGLLFKIDADGSSAKREIASVRSAVSKEVRSIGEDFGSQIPVLGRFSSMMTSSALGAAAVGVATIGAVAGVMALAKSAADAGSRFNDLAIKSGLSVETLSGLELQLKQSGASLESLTTGFFNLQKQQAAARDGSDQAAAALRRVGVDARATGEDALRQVIAGLMKITDEGARNAAGAAVMGKAYKDLSVFISDTGGDLDAVVEKARKAGLVMSTEAAVAADMLGDKLDELTYSLSAMGRELISPALPAFVGALNDITGASAGTASGLRAIGQAIASIIDGGRIAAGVLKAIADNDIRRIPGMISDIRKEQRGRVISSMAGAGGALLGRSVGGGRGGFGVPADSGGSGKSSADAAAEKAKREHEKQQREIQQRLKEIEKTFENHYNDLRDQSRSFEETDIAELRAWAERGARTHYEMELAIEAILHQRYVDLNDHHRLELALLDEGTDAWIKANDARNKSEAEAVQVMAEQARKVRAAEEKDVADRKRYNEELKRLEIESQQRALEVGGLKIAEMIRNQERRSAINRAIRENETEHENIEHARRLKEIEDAEKESLSLARNRAEQLEIEKFYNEQRLIEAERYKAAKKKIETENPTFGQEAKDAAGKPLEFGAFGENSIIDGIKATTSALKEGIAAWILYGESIGKAMKKALAAQLAKVAAEAAMQAILHAAYAIGSLAFGDFAAAAKHAIAAAKFGAVAIAAGVAARALGGGSEAASGASASGVGGGTAGGGLIDRDKRDQPAREISRPISSERVIVLRVTGDPNISVEHVRNAIRNDGPFRDELKEVVFA